MQFEQIHTDQAFSGGAPLSQAIRHGDTVYISGNVPRDPDSGELVVESVAAQTRQVMDNIGAVLNEAGSGYEHVMKCGVFVANVDEFSEMNEVYETYFEEPYPARTTVEAQMVNPEIRVEIDAIAAIPE